MTREEYGQAYEEGVDRTIRFLVSRGVARETAPDIAQSAWLRGWERLSQLRDERMVITWVNAIAMNCFRRAFRSDRGLQVLSETVGQQSSVNLAAIDVSRALASCRPRDRRLLEAQMVGITPTEMARDYGVSQTAIRLRLLRARRAARMFMEGGARAASQAA